MIGTYEYFLSWKRGKLKEFMPDGIIFSLSQWYLLRKAGLEARMTS